MESMGFVSERDAPDERRTAWLIGIGMADSMRDIDPTFFSRFRVLPVDIIFQ